MNQSTKWLTYDKCNKPGKCVIFTHKHYDEELHLSVRDKAEVNVNNITTTFKSLGFSEVKTYEDCNKQEVFDKLSNATGEDFSDYGCLFVFILTHGTDNHSLAARDKFYSLKQLIEDALNHANSSLEGKPKFFIIQACSGTEYDYGVSTERHAISKHSMDQTRISENKEMKTDSKPFYSSQFRMPTGGESFAMKSNSEQTSLFLPKFPDMMMTYASTPGMVSFRQLFIPTLCQVIEKYHSQFDMEKLLTLTRQGVAKDCCSRDKNGITTKQVPLTISTLTKSFMLNAARST